MLYDAPIVFRDTPRIKKALTHLAHKEELTLSDYVRRIFRENLEVNGMWPIPESIEDRKEEKAIA